MSNLHGTEIRLRNKHEHTPKRPHILVCLYSAKRVFVSEVLNNSLPSVWCLTLSSFTVATEVFVLKKQSVLFSGLHLVNSQAFIRNNLHMKTYLIGEYPVSVIFFLI